MVVFGQISKWAYFSSTSTLFSRVNKAQMNLSLPFMSRRETTTMTMTNGNESFSSLNDDRLHSTATQS